MNTTTIDLGKVYRVRIRKGSPRAPVFDEAYAFVEARDGKNAWIVTPLHSPERFRVLSDQFLSTRYAPQAP